MEGLRNTLIQHLPMHGCEGDEIFKAFEFADNERPMGCEFCVNQTLLWEKRFGGVVDVPHGQA